MNLWKQKCLIFHALMAYNNRLLYRWITMFNSRNKVLVLIFAMVLIAPRQAYAYLDPGTGSLLIQMLIGGVIAGLYTIKMYWYQLKSFLKRKLGNEDIEVNAESSSNDDDLI